jgi:hypothetical protein
LLVAAPGHTANYVAVSLGAAEQQIAQHGQVNRELQSLGGITHLAGAVYDHDNNDWIIVGLAADGYPVIALDDFVVALRAVFIHQRFPLVSIDPTADTESTNKLQVRYEGGIEGTQLGRDMVLCDILLKEIALERVKAQVWGVESYAGLQRKRIDQGVRNERVTSRFWFTNNRASLALREDVLLVMGLGLGIETEVLYAEVNSQAVNDPKGFRDDAGDAFASSLMLHMSDLQAAYPVLKRTTPVLALASLADAFQRNGAQPKLRFWLEQYKVARVDTPVSFERIQQQTTLREKELVHTITGGLEANPLLVRLKKGYPSAFKEAVVNFRPSPKALIWHPPLKGWRTPGAEDVEYDALLASRPKPASGFSVESRITGPAALPPKSIAPPSSPFTPPRLPATLPDYRIGTQLPERSYGPIGGVMLGGTARVSGATNAAGDILKGHFAFVVEGREAVLSPEMFAKFVTALWAVYFGEVPPGISIDPIAPGAAKHLVRYIGKVINTDLGRVMREADYLMKQWTVGTGRPDLPGYQAPDEIAARIRKLSLGWSRFWFVPDDMRFKRAGDMLLFKDGRMRVQTEYLFPEKRGQADDANEKWARFFTEHYGEIAKRYPIYEELFEYAKLVSLARYLKEQGLPLFWFLMANQDLVITEDSPGTVNALARGSEALKGLQIEGGVDLGTQGRYVMDPAALQTIQQAAVNSWNPVIRKTSAPAGDKDAPSPRPGEFSFDLQKKSYSVVPQHSSSSGTDRRGIRYQTDLALRQDGRPSLELVRYFNPKMSGPGDFGNGWSLLIPYHVKPHGSERRIFKNVRIPERMALVNLLTGREELLTFSADRYAAAGYVPAEIGSSLVVGLFLVTDGSFRLVDKLGNEYAFNSSGFLTDMKFSQDCRLKIEYGDGLSWAIDGEPYRIEPVEGERIAFRNARLPRRLRISDMANGFMEELTFSDRGPVVGYVPLRESESRFKILAIVSDGSFRLLDRKNREFRFDPAGRFNGLLSGSGRPLVESISSGEKEIAFSYTLNGEGDLVINRASLHETQNTPQPTYVIRYDYDREGRLCNVDRSSQRKAAVDTEGLRLSSVKN